MKAAYEYFVKVSTPRIGALSSVKIDDTELGALAAVTLEKRVFIIRIYDPGNIKRIERKLNLIGYTCSRIPGGLRAPIPVTPDLRKLAEQQRVAIRNIRRAHRDDPNIEALTKKYIGLIDESLPSLGA